MRKRLCIGAAVFLSCLLCSCGIETYYALDPPGKMSFPYGPIDESSNKFSFRTTETSSNNNTDLFRGTNVFYKIYTNKATLEADITTINGKNSTYSLNGYNAIRSLGYEQLDTTTKDDPLIPRDGRIKEIEIRLCSQKSLTPGITIFYNTQTIGSMTPRRRSVTSGFDFYRDLTDSNNCDDLPKSTDADTNYSSFTSPETWFVNAYAVSVGEGEFNSTNYSQLLHLGYLRISRDGR